MIREIWIPLFCILFAYSYVSTEEAERNYTPEERNNLKCRYRVNNGTVHNEEGKEEIAEKLDNMYKKMHKLDAPYLSECTHRIWYKFYHKAKNGKPQPTDVKEELVVIFEGLEIRAKRYEQGLWGHCAEEGKKELVNNISQVTIAIEEAGNVTLCDRNQLLSCHPSYNRCLCMVDNTNFREVATEYWNYTAEKNETGYNGNLKRNLCTLIIGSDCPVKTNEVIKEEDVQFPCRPVSYCLNKHTKKNCTEANLPHKRKTRSLPEDTSDGNGTSLERTGAGNNDTDSKSPNPRMANVFLVKTRSTEKPYRFLRDDYPSVHCQCYGYYAKGSTGTLVAGKISLAVTFLFIITLWFQL